MPWMANRLIIIGKILRSIRSIKKSYKDNFKTSPIPMAIHYETTYNCNCKCMFCDRWKGDRKRTGELSYEQLIGLIDQSYDLGVRIFTLSGGEPLLKKDIIKAMKYARKKGMITNITTNGTLINENNAEDIIDAFEIINISLDSWDSKKHDRLRGVKGTHEKVIEALELLKNKSKNNHINVQSTLTANNFTDILEINRKLSKKGIGTYFQPIHNNPDNLYTIRNNLDNYDWISLKEKWDYFMKNYEYQNAFERAMFEEFHKKSINFLEFPFSTKDCYDCFAGSLSFFVDPYGEVFPCDSLRISMGNIKKQALKEIWNDLKNKDLRRRIKNRECNCWLLCSAPSFMNLTPVIKGSYAHLFKKIILGFSWLGKK